MICPHALVINGTPNLCKVNRADAIYVRPDSQHMLEQFTEEQQHAMKLLGLWPEWEKSLPKIVN